MLKYIFLLIFGLLNFSCSETKNVSGNWHLEIQLDKGKILPVLVTLEQKEGISTVSGILRNSDENIHLQGSYENKTLNIDIGVSYAKIIATVKGNELEGHWVRTNKENYKVKLTGVKTTKDHLYKKYESQTSLLDMSGKWKVKLDADKYGLGTFTQKGSRVQGAIITSTGDYRYLDGFLDKNQLTLTGFDGVFSFVMDIVVSSEEFVGTRVSGTGSLKEISGLKDDNFQLENPLNITKAKENKIVILNDKDIHNNVISFDSDEYKNKIKVIQIFGSWCPNCIDETRFFTKWMKENEAKMNGVKFIALAFERSLSQKQALKDLKKISKKLRMGYPIVLLDYNKSKTPEDFLPIENFKAYPTTIYLNAKNEIVKIHTGFSGQATGEFFNSFVTDFNQTINELLNQ